MYTLEDEREIGDSMKHTILVVIIAGLMLFGCLGTIGANSENTTICVKNKFIDPGSEGSHYMIIARDGRAFEIDRSLTNLGSSNPDLIYGDMTIGKMYNIQTTGYRWDLNYNYPLIQSAEEAGDC